MSKWPLPLACLLVTGCLRAPDEAATPAAENPLTAPTPVHSDARSITPAPEPATLPAATAAAQDFARALTDARRVADAETRSTHIAAAFKAWAVADLAAARRAATALSDPEEHLSAHEGVLAAALARDAREAVAWVLGLQPPALSAVLLDQALADWVRVDAPAAGAQVARLDESDYRTVLAGEVARAWVTHDAAAATTWSAGLADQEAREEALRIVFTTLSAKEPRRAADLALVVPGEGDRAMTLELAVHAWWEHAPDEVSVWADQIADARLRGHVARLVSAQREAAIEASP